MAAASGQEDKPKRGRPRKDASSAARGPSSSPGKGKGKKETEAEAEAAGGTLPAVGDEEGGAVEGEDDGGGDVEYEYDEESLPAEMRELLRRPSKGLAELLEEAGIEFGDPSLMDDVVEGQGPEGFRAGEERGGIGVGA